MSSQDAPSVQDDPSIEDDSELWRRIKPEQVVRDDNRGILRPSSAAFSDSSDGSPMSVQLASIVAENGGDARWALASYPDMYLAALTAGQVRARKLGVIRQPLPEDPAHGGVTGEKTSGIKKYLAKTARWVIGP